MSFGVGRPLTRNEVLFLQLRNVARFVVITVAVQEFGAAAVHDCPRACAAGPDRDRRFVFTDVLNGTLDVRSLFTFLIGLFRLLSLFLSPSLGNDANPRRTASDSPATTFKRTYMWCSFV